MNEPLFMLYVMTVCGTWNERLTKPFTISGVEPVYPGYNRADVYNRLFDRARYELKRSNTSISFSSIVVLFFSLERNEL